MGQHVTLALVRPRSEQPGRYVTLRLGPPAVPVVVLPETLPTALVGAPYTHAVTATGGTGPYTFAVTSGSLPPGVTLASGGTFSGTPTDAAAYWTAGSVYVFSASGALPRDPLMGSDQSVDYPQLTQRLPNGQTLRIDRGVSRMSVRLRFNGRITDDIAALARYARSGKVWLDMGLPTAQGCQWPLTHVDDGITRQWAGHNREPMTIPLLELA
mgnify:CR=1 FL=1